MKRTFDYFRQLVDPDMYLCNPDGRKLAFVKATNRAITLRLNDLSELTFTVERAMNDAVVDTDGETIYEKIKSKRKIYLENVGWFQIKNVVDNDTGENASKEVTAESLQGELKNRGFVSEERVYMFYNPNDPTDALYSSGDTAAIPSVAGQLYQQLGIQLKLGVGDVDITQDYDEWTIVYIDDSLYFTAASKSNIYSAASGVTNVCRSFKDETTYGYDFMINEVQEAFEVIFEFDFLHHAIKVKPYMQITEKSDVYVSFDNIMNSIAVTEDAENIITVLTCEGDGIDISLVNPMGTNYICDFNYYMQEKTDADGNAIYPWMSSPLIAALKEWKSIYDSYKSTYETKIASLQTLQVTKAENSAAVQKANLKLIDLQKAQSDYVLDTANNNGTNVVESVDLGQASLLGSAVGTLTENSTLTLHQSAPAIGDDGYFEFADTGTSTKVSAALSGYLPTDDDTTNTSVKLFFTDHGNAKDYCKLVASVEAFVAKDEDGVAAAIETGSTGYVAVSDTLTFKVKNTTSGVFVYTSSDEQLVLDSDNMFTYNDLRYKVARPADNFISIYRYYVTGYERIAYSTELGGNNGWVSKWEAYLQTLKASGSTTDSSITSLEAELKTIADTCNVQKYIRNKGMALYRELGSYWIEGEYTNDSIAVTDSMTLAEQMSLAKELMAAGEEELSKESQPKFSISVDAINFPNLIEFRGLTDNLELGKIVIVEKGEDELYYPALISMSFNLDDPSSFELEFSNASKLNETSMTIADILNQSSSTSRTVSANWANLTSYAKNKETVESLIYNPLDRTLRAVNDNLANQEFTVGNDGILGRKWSDDSHTAFLPEQVRLVNNVLIFTDDNWATAKTALGKITIDDDGTTAYGLLADTIIGSLLVGETLSIQNSDKSITIDGNGIVITNNGTEVFKALSDGTLVVNGYADSASVSAKFVGYDKDMRTMQTSITANATGISTEVTRAQNAESSLSSRITQNATDITAKVSSSGGDDSSFSWILTAEGFFLKSNDSTVLAVDENGLTVSGTINADDGIIGGFTIGETNLYNNDAIMGKILVNGVYHPAVGIGSWNSDYTLFTPTASIIDDTVTATQGTFQSVTSRQVDASGTISADTISADTIRARRFLSPSDTSTTIGFYFGYGAGSVRYHATLSWSANMLYCTIYDSSGTETTLSEARSFTVYYACIWGGQETWTATVEAGTSKASCNTKAFWGIDYATFVNGNNNVHNYYFTITGSSADYTVTTRGHLVPWYNDQDDLGSEAYRYNNIYLGTSPNVESDQNHKNTIATLGTPYDAVFDALRPVTYKYNSSTSNRTHTGFIAQELKTAILAAGLTTQDCAAYCEWQDEEGNTGCGIRYEELIALCVNEIQKLKKEVQSLETALQKN